MWTTLIMTSLFFAKGTPFVQEKNIDFGVRRTDTLIDVFPDKSFLDCMKECSHRRRCRAINYVPSMHVCELSPFSYAINLKKPASGYITVHKTHWNKEAVANCRASNCNVGQKCEWITSQEVCVVSDCGNAPWRQWIYPRQTNIGVYSKAYYECNTGYKRNGDGVSGCKPDGTWENPDFNCEIVDCGPPASIGNNMIVNYTTTEYLSIANVTCEEKYISVNSGVTMDQIQCREDGKWRDLDITCEWGGCSAVNNSDVPSCIDQETVSGLYIGDNVTYRGKTTTGNYTGPDAVRKCKNYRQWDPLPDITCSGDEDCMTIQSYISTSGIFSITRPKYTTLTYCDMDFQGGGWTVIQRRLNGEVDFKRTWAEYKAGFGDVASDFWIGNDVLYDMTNPTAKRVVFVMQDQNGNERYSEYTTFQVDSEDNGYRLNIDGYVSRSGAAGDSLYVNANGKLFTTIDNDQDEAVWGNCAQHFHGGWWYGACHTANPNGRWGQDNSGGIVWISWKGMQYSMTKMIMMIQD